MIGKYNQFLVGWNDVPNDLTIEEINEYHSSLRLEYIDLLKDARLI